MDHWSKRVPNSLRQVIDEAYEDGRYSYSTFRRTYPFVAVAGTWVDLSMASGGPPANYYLGEPLMAYIPTNWFYRSIWHGAAVSPAKKYLHKICMLCTGAGGSPAPFILCDYLMYYMLIDMDSTEEQFFINYGETSTPVTDPLAAVLPRYTDGVGVQAFLVATNPYVGGMAFQIKYTNSSDVADRYSQVQLSNTSTNIGTLLHSGTTGVNWFGSPFIHLAPGDRGIKSVQSIQFFGANGGLGALVLVKPIATLMTREVTAWCEFDFIKDKPSMPRIYDGAYLNLLANPTATMATVPTIGEITTIWGN